MRQLFFSLVISAGMLAPAQGQELTFTLVEQFVIGDDEEASAEYLLSFPEDGQDGLERQYICPR